MKKLITYLFFVSVAVGFNSCANEADPVADKTFFTKFYDNSAFNVTYTPLDAVQTSDGGYVVLGLKKLIDEKGLDVYPANIYLMKVDALGEFVSDHEFASDLKLQADVTTPAPNLLNVGGKFYFFGLKTTGLTTQLIEVSENATVTQQIDVVDPAQPDRSYPYPLAAAVDGTNLLLLNYDVGTKESRMSIVNVGGQVLKTKSYTIGAGDGVEEPIMSSILRTGRLLPFQVGKTSTGLYFFNGYQNYTMSVSFTDLNADDALGVVQGNQEDGWMSQLLPLAGGKFAASRSNYGDNYVMPQATLATSGFSQSANVEGLPFPELVPNAPVKIIGMKVGDTDKVIYGSNTRGKQIVLLAYNPADGSFSGSRYLGFSNAFELASLTPTVDNGLLVVGTTYIAGRFPRICFFKLSAEALAESFKK